MLTCSSNRLYIILGGKSNTKVNSKTGNSLPPVPVFMGWRLLSPPLSGLSMNTLTGSCSPASAPRPFPALLPISYLYFDICFSCSQDIFRGKALLHSFSFWVPSLPALWQSSSYTESVILSQLFYALLPLTFSCQSVIFRLTKQYFILRALDDSLG